MGLTKKKAQNIHAKKRAYQRYGIKLNRKKRLEIIKMIQNNKATLVEKQSNRISVFSLVYEKKKVKVVYDKSRKTLVSFLPLIKKVPAKVLHKKYKIRDQYNIGYNLIKNIKNDIEYIAGNKISSIVYEAIYTEIEDLTDNFYLWPICGEVDSEINDALYGRIT